MGLMGLIWGRGDKATRRQGDGATRGGLMRLMRLMGLMVLMGLIGRQGDKATRRRGDKGRIDGIEKIDGIDWETRGRGDRTTRRRGDKVRIKVWQFQNKVKPVQFGYRSHDRLTGICKLNLFSFTNG